MTTPLSNMLAGELRVQLGKLSRRMREQAHPNDFTSSQKSVILRLDQDGPATVSDLARAEGVRQQSMGATVASLQAAGALDASPDPTDGRRTILSLSAACRNLLQTTRAAKQDWLVRAIQSTLTPAEQEELASAVALLKRLADS